MNRLYEVSYPMPALGSGASNPNDVEAYHCLESGVPTSYDPNGNLLCKTKRDGTTVIQYRYDALNRRTLKLFVGAASADVSYAYDLAGRPLNALYENQTGAPGVAWSYDSAGRRISEAGSITVSGTPTSEALAFTYDKDSNPHTLTWPDGGQANYVYDTADRFVSVGNANAGTVSAGYDTLSCVNALTRASSSSTIGYDAADRMVSLAHVFTPTTGNQTWTLGFTAGGQLASSVSSNVAWDWQATPVTAVATVANGLNQNASVGGTSWTYDKNGNLTSDGVRNFTYDAENRLLTESGPISMTLSYDPTGRLQQSAITVGLNTSTTQFLWDGDALVQEFDGAGTRLRRYFHGPQVDDPVLWVEGASMSGTAHYLIADRQGSIAGQANSAGTVTKNYTYDPYGVPNAWGAIGTDPRFRYTGQAAIPEAQLYYYKARVYDPAAGKFLQTDPVGDESDLNFYAYVRDDPTNATDPSGNCPIVFCGAGGSVGPSPDGGAPDTEGVVDQALLTGTVVRTTPQAQTVGGANAGLPSSQRPTPSTQRTGAPTNSTARSSPSPVLLAAGDLWKNVCITIQCLVGTQDSKVGERGPEARPEYSAPPSEHLRETPGASNPPKPTRHIGPVRLRPPSWPSMPWRWAPTEPIIIIPDPKEFLRGFPGFPVCDPKSKEGCVA